MKRAFFDFLRDEDGAVTVDWVVLTAAVVGLAGVVMGTMNTATGNVATGVSNTIANTSVDRGF